mgnify:FL=1
MQDIRLPGYTRFDSAAYQDLNEHWSAQVNAENMFNTEYWISSHNNISYGAPTSAFATVKARWTFSAAHSRIDDGIRLSVFEPKQTSAHSAESRAATRRLALSGTPTEAAIEEKNWI